MTPFSDTVVPGKVSGMDYLRDPKLFKGMAFSLEERQTLGIHGLLPPRIKTQEEMAEHSMRNLRRFDDPLNKYIYMADLSDRNEKLFYKVLSENTVELMPTMYKPTVGLACQKFGLAFKIPKSLFITIHNKGFPWRHLHHIFDSVFLSATEGMADMVQEPVIAVGRARGRGDLHQASALQGG